MTALFGTVWVLWQYFAYGRLATREMMHAAMQRHEDPPSKRQTPFPVMVANGALHCGAAYGLLIRDDNSHADVRGRGFT